MSDNASISQQILTSLGGGSGIDIFKLARDLADVEKEPKQLALESEFIIVIGSKNSSNSNRLKELAEKCGATSILIDGANEIDFEKLSQFKSIGITAGASAPESIVQKVVKVVSNKFNAIPEELGENKENIYFRLPPELR